MERKVTSLPFTQWNDPQERDMVIDNFRCGRSKVLISTNVLARGIDILQVSLVINF